MHVLTLPPKLAADYLEDQERQSLRPLAPYLWTSVDSSDPTITELSREALIDLELEEGQRVCIDASIFTALHKGQVLVLSHEMRDGALDALPRQVDPVFEYSALITTTVLLVLPNDDGTLENVIQALTEARMTLSEGSNE